MENTVLAAAYLKELEVELLLLNSVSKGFLRPPIYGPSADDSTF
ncbi:hypothetical protein [Dyadobacter pollutisoli]|uniref:Uncharacterized protein n=1 Tax=Dyadobacter pollutisoli TaxID=2910158 RepID=A0A9E8NJA5_9BACT|nr:hypothetical protein [Dyadobacter pollutisoli]WAC15054.1 hypothetical protein ON006_14025 [Dyadobacter pollutisoli]